MKIDFESFLSEEFLKNYTGFKNTFQSDFVDWMDTFQIDDWISLGNKFAQKLLNERKEEGR